MTTFYKQGTYFERITKEWLIREGYYVMRSAGSKGVGDLAVFPLKGCNDVGLGTIHPYVIQLKSIDVEDFDSMGNIIPYHLLSEVSQFAMLHFNNNYVDKYLFIYDRTKKIKEPYIYKWVIHRWVLLENEDGK